MVRLRDLNMRRRDSEDLLRRAGEHLTKSKAVLEARPAASSSAVTLRGDLERADASSSTDGDES